MEKEATVSDLHQCDATQELKGRPQHRASICTDGSTCSTGNPLTSRPQPGRWGRDDDARISLQGSPTMLSIAKTASRCITSTCGSVGQRGWRYLPGLAWHPKSSRLDAVPARAG